MTGRDRLPNHRFVLALLVLIGVALRLVLWLRANDLWLDESMLAAGIMLEPLPRLLGLHLHFTSVAPPLFMALEWVAYQFGGASELVLRLPALIGGIAFLPLLAVVADRWFRPAAAMAVVALAACSPTLIRYSAELKPYGLEPVVGLALVVLALRARSKGGETKPWLQLAVAGVVAALTTFPTPIALGAIAVAFTLDRELWTDRKRPALLGLAVVPGIVVGALLQLAMQADRSLQSYLQVFWGYRFAGFHPVKLASLHIDWTTALLFGATPDTARASFGLLILVLAGLGAWWVVKRQGGPVAAMLVVPILLASAASVVSRLPLHFRLVLFLAPALYLLIGAGLSWLLDRERLGAAVAVAVGAVLLAKPGAKAARFQFGEVDDQRVGTWLDDPAYRQRADEPTYLFPRAVPGFLVYQGNEAGDRPTLATIVTMVEHTGPNAGNAPPRGHRVVNEGFDQQVRLANRLYLVGVSTGVQYRAGQFRTVPDSGWARNEVSRIESVGSACAWLLMNVADYEMPALLAEFTVAGWEKTQETRTRGGGLFRVCKADPSIR